MELREHVGEKRILLIPFAPGIGDMVMMEPLLRAVVIGLPDARVTMVGCEYAADLLPPGPYQLATSSYFWSEPPAALRPLHRLIPQKVVAWAAEPAMALDLGPFTNVFNLFWEWESRLPFDRWWTPGLYPEERVRHSIDLLADFLEEELGCTIPVEERKPRVHLFPEAVAWADDYLAENGLLDQPVAALVVSAANSLKWWDPMKWAELVEHLTSLRWSTVLIAPQQNAHARQVFELCRAKPLWPDLDIRRMAGLLSRSSTAISIDTGPLHMASALGTPWVGLFGPTNPDAVGPYDGSRGRVLLADFSKPSSCRSCHLAFKNRDDRCLSLPTTGCTALIPVDSVLEAFGRVAAIGRASGQPGVDSLASSVADDRLRSSAA